jgi:DNA-binding response OmpR family regulator
MKTKHNILICDDNEYVRTALGIFISDIPGVSADLAKDGQEGLNKILDNDYDLIIMDMQMPIFSGLDLIGYIREIQKSDVPIIVLTGHVHDELRKTLELFEVSQIFTKPFAPSAIEEAVLENLHLDELAYHV